ncbi:MAG: hypothetical protein GF364_01590, partial [Candidatus Lokiarchaeota archaeon]|nr:hypothetical protein [Candidatus Lokiarchaeota archaeon]
MELYYILIPLALFASIMSHYISIRVNKFDLVIGKKEVNIPLLVDFIGLGIIIYYLVDLEIVQLLSTEPYIYVTVIVLGIIVAYLGIAAAQSDKSSKHRLIDEVIPLSETQPEMAEQVHEKQGVITCALIAAGFILLLHTLAENGLIEGTFLPKGATQDSQILALFTGIMSDPMVMLSVVFGIIGLLASYAKNKYAPIISDIMINWIPALLFAMVLFG